MAIVQISRITNRKGLTENLPQLAGAEFGWCTDSRRLFIGNGTLQSGAPVIGNTEILTEFSDITVLADYTYEDIVVGYAAQTGPTPSDPVVRSVQAKLDDFADVRDFGAVGDGEADDTAAINRALFQLYCRENNTQIRRALYFPAGTYRVTSTIIIPTYAKLVGEGANCSIILLDLNGDSSLADYVARFGDSRQQIDVNIGVGSAVAPRNIEISSMTFQSAEVTDVFLVEDAQQCWFESVNFIGPYTEADIQDTGITDIAGVRFASTTSDICNDIVFERCGFYRTKSAINTIQATQGITISNSGFNTLQRGLVIGGDATGFRAVHNVFDNIYAQGIVYSSSLNVSGYNAFYNVGNSIGSTSPTHPVIEFNSDNNVSVGDMFERDPDSAIIQPPIEILINTASQGSSGSQLGRYTREFGRTFTLANNQTNQAIFSVNALKVRAFNLMYTIIRDNDTRTGTLQVVSQASDGSTISQVYADEYSETFDVGVTLSAIQTGNIVTVQYSTTNTGASGTITYSISHLA